MCPLRVILIFLSAALAGFFVLRSMKTEPEDAEAEESGDARRTQPEKEPLRSKMRSAVSCGFWTCVDMASGRYLWRNLVSPPPAAAAAAAAKKSC